MIYHIMLFYMFIIILFKPIFYIILIININIFYFLILNKSI